MCDDREFVSAYCDSNLNSAGESESSTPPSSVSSENADGAGERVKEGAQRPLRSRSRPPVFVHMASLDGVVGACKRGRRRGRRNKTTHEKASEVSVRQRQKNERERQRVKNVNLEYQRLRIALGEPEDSHKKKNNKFLTLKAAIDYIKALMDELDSRRRESGTVPHDGSEEAASGSGLSYRSGTISSSLVPNPEGRLHTASGTYELRHHPTPDLNCEESLDVEEESISSNDPDIYDLAMQVHPAMPSPEAYFGMMYSPDSSLPSTHHMLQTVSVLPPSPPLPSCAVEIMCSPPLPSPATIMQPFPTPELFPSAFIPQGHLLQTDPSVSGYPLSQHGEFLETVHQSWPTVTPLSSPPTLSHYPSSFSHQ